MCLFMFVDLLVCIFVEPVAETKGILLSVIIFSPIDLPDPIVRQNSPSKLLAFMTLLQMCWTAIAVRGVFEDGFQIMVSPQTAAIVEFQDHTATGKLNALIIPITPNGCHCSYIL